MLWGWIETAIIVAVDTQARTAGMVVVPDQAIVELKEVL